MGTFKRNQRGKIQLQVENRQSNLRCIQPLFLIQFNQTKKKEGLNVETIGTRIAALRKKRGLTQEQLGSQVGVSAQAVSKWENGGAPDVELLPALADRLGVSVDALFGRQEREVQDMGALLGRWLRSQPGSRRLQSLFELLFSNLYNLGLPLELQGQFLQQDLLESSAFVPRGGEWEEERCWLRSEYINEEGIVLNVPARDFPMLLLLPEPKPGYASAFADFDESRKLFAVLSRPGALELLCWFLRRKHHTYATAPAVARGIGAQVGAVEPLLEELVACNLLSATPLETEEGRVTAYQNNDQEGLVPFLYFTRWLLEKNEAWINCWNERENPILREEAAHG